MYVNLTIDEKVRIGFLLASAAIAAFAVFAGAHGIYLSHLDGIGGSGHV